MIRTMADIKRVVSTHKADKELSQAKREIVNELTNANFESYRYDRPNDSVEQLQAFCRDIAENEVDEFIALAQLQLVDELMEQLPDKRVGTAKMPLNDIERGYNVCAEDAISVLQQYKANLEERG